MSNGETILNGTLTPDCSTTSISQDVSAPHQLPGEGVREFDAGVREFDRSIPVFVCLVAITLATLFGNILTVVSHWKYPSNWLNSEAANIFLINVAMADLIAGVVVSPLFAAKTLSSKVNSNIHVCIVSLMVFSISVQVSANFLILATVDKYVAIRWPFRHLKYFTKTRAKHVAVFVWLYLSIVFLGMVYTQWNAFEQVKRCAVVHIFPLWSVIVVGIVDVGAFVLMLSLNVVIFFTVQRLIGNPSVPATQQVSRANQAVSNNNRRAWKVIGTVVITYILCRLPMSSIIIVYFVYGNDHDDLVDPVFYSIVVSLMNSTMNPFIYYTTMPGIRAAFKKVLGLKT